MERARLYAWRTLALAVVSASLSCAPAAPDPLSIPSEDYRDQVRFGLTFEERMALRARVTVLTFEAQKAADQIYPRRVSREGDIKNEEYAKRLADDSKRTMLEKHGIGEEELEAIIDEYLRSQATPVR